MPTYRIDLAYDGTPFHGYARQRGLRTVQGAFEEALFRHTGPVDTVVAGRTDRGVHATGQVVSFAVDRPIDAERVARSLNRQLRPEIAVQAVSEVPESFHARFSAASRRYLYQIWNAPVHDPLTAQTAWHVPDPLDAGVMDRSVAALIGLHDFASFCRKATGRSTIREIVEASWSRIDHRVELSIEASAFCHQMVRSIVAVSAEIGRGRLHVDDMQAILDARDRGAGRGAAPPHGLTLVAVAYQDAYPGFSASHITP